MINESERASLETFLAIRMRSEIASGKIKMAKKDIEFATLPNDKNILFPEETNEEFFQNIEKAAEKFGRTTKPEEE